MSTKNKSRAIPAQERFAAMTCQLMDYIREILMKSKNCPDMKNFNMACVYVENEDEDLLVKNFLTASAKFWDHIHDKNRIFFETEGPNLAPERYGKYLRPYLDFAVKKIKEDEEEELWSILHSMVKASIHYMYENKNFGVNSLPDLPELAIKWSVKLGTVVYESDSDSSASSDSD